MKRFLRSIAIFCLMQAPCAALGASAAGGLATELFTYDPKLAPIKLEYVDFKIDRNRTAEKWGENIGQYNFKLFGCRRSDKKIMLDQGRAMRRDMKFGNVFFEELNELFPVVVSKDSPYFPYSIGDVLPGYLITAEIKDLYVNVCDHYDWRTRTYSQLRSGSAEIKVLWRVITPYNRKLYWEDTTYGYANLQDPVRDGEVKLVEKAFADALVRLIGMPGFIEVMRHKPDPKMLAAAKAEYDNLEYQHIVNRRKLISSYRRRRMTFGFERARQRELEILERLAPSESEMNDGVAAGMGNVTGLGGVGKGRLDGTGLDGLSDADAAGRGLDGLAAGQTGGEGLGGVESEAARRAKETGIDVIFGKGGIASLMEDPETGRLMFGRVERDGVVGYLGKLLPDTLEYGQVGKVIKVNPLLSIFDGFMLPENMDNETKQAILNGDSRLGFVVSPIDGWITINNQKPFRFLSPTRLYRVRSSVVAVSSDTSDNIGAGFVIAPSLVLANFSTVQGVAYPRIEFLDGRVFPAMVLRSDPSKDAALLYMPPVTFSRLTWPVPLRLDLPDVGESFYAVGTPMKGGFEGALEEGKVAGYRFFDNGVEILTNTNVQSVTLGGILVDGHGNAVGFAHAGENTEENRRDGFIPIGDAFDALKIRVRDRDMDETPYQKALRLKKMRDAYTK